MPDEMKECPGSLAREMSLRGVPTLNEVKGQELAEAISSPSTGEE